MITVLNVAEKPSVARNLAQVFGQCPGASSSNNGPRVPNQAAQVFTIDNVRFPSVMSANSNAEVPHRMVVTSVRGHLSNIDFAGNFRSWGGCSPAQLFSAPLEVCVDDDKRPLENTLKGLARQCGALILWLDCDREGEHIAYEVQQVCEKGNSRLSLNSNGFSLVYRAKFSTVLPNEIQRALRTLGRLDMRMVDAVAARMELDLRVGSAFTRFQTYRLQQRFDGFNDKVISYGPCQFPTLGFVVERWARIETFVPEDFWTIEMSITVDDANDENSPTGRSRGRTLKMNWKRGRIYDHVLALAFFDVCRDFGEATVTNIYGRPKNRWRPIPLATVELQKRCAKFLNIGSESFMHSAEALYNDGLISYPRTETEIFSPEFQHQPLITSLQEIPGELGTYATKLLNENKYQLPRAGKNDDKAHPPITPCRAVDPNTISDLNQRKIYTLVVKHYLACCSQDAQGKETEMITQMGSEVFSAKGLMITDLNWLEIYKPWERWGTGQGLLPTVEIGKRFVPSQLNLTNGRTAPPALLSEAELITLMDKSGIGTDATIAQHIATIQDRSYAEKDQSQRFHPTQLGIALVEGYNNMGYQLNRPDLRREVEHECNLVATGRKTKEAILVPIIQKMKEIFDRANTEANKLDAAVARHFRRIGSDNRNSLTLQNNFSQCSCGQLMCLKTSRRNGDYRPQSTQVTQDRFVHCTSCDIGFMLPRGEPTPAQDERSTVQKCAICNFQVIKISRGNGYEGKGYHVCPKCFTDSPVEHGGNGSGSFRCFSCTHPTCSLASGTSGGGIEIFQCPFCSIKNQTSSIVLKKTSKGGFMLSCSSYGSGNRCEYTIWLPREASTITPLLDSNDNGSIEAQQTRQVMHNSCRRCPNRPRKLHFVWKNGTVPPHFGREHTACVLCDDFLKQEMGVKIPMTNQVRTNAMPRQNNGRSRNVSGRGRAR